MDITELILADHREQRRMFAIPDETSHAVGAPSADEGPDRYVKEHEARR